MNCHQVEKLLSELVEGALSPARESAVREHLAGCSRCTADLEGFRSALGALREVGRPRTPASVQAVILGAVDAAAQDGDDSREEVFRRAVLLARGGAALRRRRASWASHAAAVLLTAAAVVLFFTYFRQPGDESRVGEGRLAEALEREPELVEPGPDPVERGALSMLWSGAPPRLRSSGSGAERPAQVDAEGRLTLSPGDVLASEGLRLSVDEAGQLSVAASAPEPRVVEVERVRTVEKLVEVPVRVEVERVVRRGPLLVLDTAPIASAVQDLAAVVEGSNRVRELELALAALEREAEQPGASAARRPRADPGPGRPSATRRSHGPSLSVRRENGRMRLETRGALGELVPVLLARLGDEDGEVVALVERRLEEIRERARANPELAPRLVDPEPDQETPSVLDRLFRGREAESATSWEESWNGWWQANGELLATAERAGDF